MMRKTLQLALVAVVLSGLACDETPVEPEFGKLPPSPGQGSGTLRVVAQVEGREVSDAVFETEFLATVTDTLGEPVSGAVVVSGLFGRVQLSEGSPGSYSATRPGYETGSYTLSVESEAGSVTGLTTPAPNVHQITTPTAGEVVEANTALLVRWTSATAAGESRVETRDYDSDWFFGDTGVFWTPTLGNPARTDQRVRVTRRNFQIPAGALPLSRFSVGIRCT
ncbi:MAG: hypothetical protein OEN01_08720, partial [Candidatus Krumholzibacteria bacterium]|nr:hypothetical protein [Candidatus Krumholzibacteria bacterium]